MGSYKLVSLDVFGTLIDLQNLHDSFWKALDGSIPPGSVNMYQTASNEIVFRMFERDSGSVDHFRSVRSMFEASFRELLLRFSLDFDPVEAARLLISCHVDAQLYPDALPFMKAAGTAYPLCLSCDADNDMLSGPRRLHDFQDVFTSEDLKTYKLYGDGSFFRMVADRCGLRPAEIIHRGDSPIEVVGAQKAGLATCWLNRTGRVWPHHGRSDYEVHSLDEAARVLGVEAKYKVGDAACSDL